MYVSDNHWGRAGRGIRLMPETEGIPQCTRDGMGGQCVLDWILDSLAHAGIDDVVFIGGYQIEKVVQAYLKGCCRNIIKRFGR